MHLRIHLPSEGVEVGRGKKIQCLFPVLAPGQVNHILQVVGLGIEWEIGTVLFLVFGAFSSLKF